MWGNVIEAKLYQPKEFCWLCKGEALEYLNENERGKLGQKFDFADKVAKHLEQILNSRRKKGVCQNGRPHNPSLRAIHLGGILYQVNCTRCGKALLVYSVQLGR